MDQNQRIVLKMVLCLFRKVTESDFVANMPAPETQDDVNIEAFGSEGKKAKK